MSMWADIPKRLTYLLTNDQASSRKEVCPQRNGRPGEPVIGQTFEPRQTWRAGLLRDVPRGGKKGSGRISAHPSGRGRFRKPLRSWLAAVGPARAGPYALCVAKGGYLRPGTWP